MAKFIDLTGQRFGRLVVIERAPNKPNCGNAIWKCRCDCGNVVSVRGSRLYAGCTKSCGCLAAEKASERSKKHGGRNSRLYYIWAHMKHRCNNPNSPVYSRYGERGIMVCPQWENSFEVFRDWAMANGYNDTLTIDRIDNNKGYCPENCRWVALEVQAKNRRSSHLIEHNGKTQILADWAREIGLSVAALHYRLKSGWSVERALTTPVKKRK